VLRQPNELFIYSSLRALVSVTLFSAVMWFCVLDAASITWPKYAGQTTTDSQLSGQIAPRMLPSLQSATSLRIRATASVT